MNLESFHFDYDPFTKIERIFHYDHADDTSYIETIQHGDEAMELTKASFNGFDERAGWKGDDLHHVAHIPPVVLEDLRRRGILDDDKAFRKWLNDRDNRCFRTRPGRI